MFSTPRSFGARNTSATAYRDVGASTALDGASPHKLVSLLYGMLSSELAAARGAMQRGDIAEKGRAILHAVRIVDEGLNAPLNMDAGGTLAANLRDLYEYILQRLTHANLRNDADAIGECARLIDALREGWDGIADHAHAAAA